MLSGGDVSSLNEDKLGNGDSSMNGRAGFAGDVIGLTPPLDASK
jgi:hypothetical protein